MTIDVREVSTYEVRMAGVETCVSILTWMVGANIAMTMAIFFRVFNCVP